MYAVIETGGKQYRVQPGDVLTIEKLKVDAGEKIEFDKVLAFSDDNELQVGTPYLDAARVVANVVENGKGQKVIVYKFKAKKDYRKKQGHRQPYTMVEIDSFLVSGKTVAQKPAEEKKAEKAEATKEEKAEKPAAKKASKAKAEDKEDTKAEKPAAKKAAAKPKTEKASETKAEKPAAKKAAKPKAEKPAEEKPAEEKPAEEAPAVAEEKKADEE